MNLLKDKLARGDSVVGTWCEIPSPEFVNVLATSGLDFVIVDMEHGAMDFRLAYQMTLAAQAEGCSSIIRVSKNDPSEILRTLEVSPNGILVPHIETVLDRKKTTESAFYPPVGSRSLNPFTRAGGYTSSPDLTDKQNKEMLLSIIVEGKKGIKNLEKIIDENVDLVYIGTYDISLSLGIPGDVKNKKVIKTIEKMVKTIRKKGKAAGCMFHDEDEFNFFKSIGIQFLCYKVDTSVVFEEFSKIKKLNKRS